MLKVVSNWIFIVLLALLAFNIFIVPPAETKILYFPVKEMVGNPGTVRLAYEDVYLKTPDGEEINGWFVPNKASKKVVLFFHGNSGNISYRLDWIAFLYRLPANVFIVDYRGFGRSQGKISEKGMYQDAKTAYDYLVKEKKYRPDQIVIFGKSLGGAVAADLAAKEKASALILLNTFTSVKDLAVYNSPLWRWPFVWIKSDFNTLSKIDRINAPVLIIHSKQDDLIPYRMGLELYDKAREPKKLFLIENGGAHNDFIVTQEYIKNFNEIINGK